MGTVRSGVLSLQGASVGPHVAERCAPQKHFLRHPLSAPGFQEHRRSQGTANQPRYFMFDHLFVEYSATMNPHELEGT